MIEISKNALWAIQKLTECGYEAYAVGGAIRDIIMGKGANDFDITTSATPEQMKLVFEGERLIETGIKHGTVTIVKNHENLEITTYRKDGKYDDNRHPKSVEFTSSLEDDLSRRDFTVNALAYSPISDTLVDYFDGTRDIQKRVIRAIGEPQKRFEEDALRILRAIRFSATLGFKIEEKTKDAMQKCAHLIKNISKERIAIELNKLLCGKNAKNAILENYSILGLIIPEIKKMHGFDQRNSWHVYDILTHTAVVVENIPPVPHLRLIALLHDIGKVHTFSVDENGVGHFYGHNGVSAERAREFFNEYKYDNFTKERCCQIISLHDTPIEPTKIFIKKRLNRMGKDAFFDLIAIKRADNLAQNLQKVDLTTIDKIEQIAKQIIEEESCFSLKDLAVNGKDLTDIGFEKGKKIGEILEYLLNEVIEERTINDKQTLINIAKTKFGG